MSYIVVYQKSDGTSGVEECGDLDLAIVTAERLRNVDSVESPRIFKTEEIRYDFRPYYRVEVSGESDSSVTASAGSSSAMASGIPAQEMPASFDPAPVETSSAFETAAPAQEVAPVEASVETVDDADILATEPIDLPAPMETPDRVDEVAAVEETTTRSESPFATATSVTPPPPPIDGDVTTPATDAGAGLFGRIVESDPTDAAGSDAAETVADALSDAEAERPRRGLFGR